MEEVAVDRLDGDVLRIVDSEDNTARLRPWETSLVTEGLENRIASHRRRPGRQPSGPVALGMNPIAGEEYSAPVLTGVCCPKGLFPTDNRTLS